MSRVRIIHNESEFSQAISQAQDKLVAVEFSAEWCEPCKQTAPLFAELSTKYTSTIFLNVDVDELKSLSMKCGVKGMPCFQFFKKGQKVYEFTGADPQKLQNYIKQNSAPEEKFPGGGNRLGGSSGSSNPPPYSQQTTTPPQVVPQYTQQTTAQPQFKPAPTAAGSKDPVNEMLLQQLVDMGFPQNRANKALTATGGKNVDAAMDWIFKHMDDTDIDDQSESTSGQRLGGSDTKPADSTQTTEQKPVTASSDNQPMQAESTNPDADQPMTEAEKAQSLVCNDCGKLLRDEEAVAKHASITGHVDFAESKQAPPPKLSKEEQMKIIQERLEQKKKERAEQDNTGEKEREIIRRSQGKDVVESKRKWEEQQAKKLAEEQRKEKEADRAARQKIKEKIEQDKLNRQAKAGAVVEPVKPVVIVPVQSEAPKKEYTEAKINIRLLNGSSIQGMFKPDDTLQTVQQWVAANRTDGFGPFFLMTTYPKKIYTQDQLKITLKNAGFVPSGTFVITKP